MTTADAAKTANVGDEPAPDHIRDGMENEIAPHMTAGKTLMFAHGFSIHSLGVTKPPADVDVSMTAPE